MLIKIKTISKQNNNKKMKSLVKTGNLQTRSESLSVTKYVQWLIQNGQISASNTGLAERILLASPRFRELAKQGKFDLYKAVEFAQLDTNLELSPYQWIGEVKATDKKLSFAAIKSYGSENVAISSITKVIAHFSEAAFGSALNPFQLQFAASSILQQYWYFCIDDLRAALKRGFQGVYSNGGAIIFGQFSSVVIMEWICAYDKELTAAFEEKRIKESQSHKGINTANKSADGLPMPDFIKQTAEKIQRTAEIKEALKSVSARLARAKENARNAEQVVTFCKDRLFDAATTKAQALELKTHLAQKTGYLSSKAIEIETLQIEYNAILQSLENAQK